jgi:hypothetical protein
MRCLVGFVVVLALVALPLSASAQADEEGEASGPDVVEGVPTPEAAPEEPSTEPTPEEPALQLKLDEAGVEVAPKPRRTADGYTREELELRKRRAALGLIAPAVVTAAGVALLVFGTSGDCYDYQLDDWSQRDACVRPRIAGAVLTSVGGAGMIAGSALVGRRAKEFRSAQGYTPEELQLRVKRAVIGLYVSALSFLAGAFSMAFAGVCGIGEWTERCDRLWSAGITLMVGGGIGMIVSAALLGNRKHQLRELRQAHYETRRRVRWDLERSAVVF